MNDRAHYEFERFRDYEEFLEDKVNRLAVSHDFIVDCLLDEQFMDGEIRDADLIEQLRDDRAIDRQFSVYSNMGSVSIQDLIAITMRNNVDDVVMRAAKIALNKMVLERARQNVLTYVEAP